MNNIPTYLFALIVASLTIVSCGSKKAIKKAPEGAVKYGLSKGACFGRCPIYELQIFEGGKASFEGKKFTPNIGLYEGQVPSDMYKALEKAFAAADFMAYPDSFPSLIPDLPAIRISHHNGTESKTVWGKEDRPDTLLQLQFMLEAIIDDTEWTLVEAFGSNKYDAEKAAEVKFIYDELIVQPHPGKMMGVWFDKYKAHGLRLVKKLAPDLDYFLLTYDMTTIEPNAMLEKLKADSAIRLVEFNKNTDQRSESRGR